MVKYGVQLAIGSQGNQVSAKTCTKDDGPFKCVICEKELSLRAGSKTPHHFIHRVKSSCEGNTDEHRAQADSLGSIGSIDENDGENYSMEPEADGSIGSIDKNEDENPVMEPEEMSNDSVYQVLEELIPIEKLSEETQDPEVPDIEGVEEEPVPSLEPEPVPDPEKDETTLAEDVSNEIITQALEMVDDIIKPHKCCQCKARGSDFHQMFSSESRTQFGLNDLYVCSEPTCFVECPNCSMPNSQKRHKKFGMCFSCDFIGSEWKEQAVEAVKNMTPIPEAPIWLTGRRAIMVIKMLARKRKARIVYNFMFENKDRTPEFKNKVREVLKAKKIAKALKKVRAATEKNRKRNQQRREAAMGTDGSDRLTHMYANRRETCFACDKHNKRRFMVKYASVMGTFKYSCKSCSKTCPECQEPCTKHDMNQFGDQCFDCFAWNVCTRSDEWKTNQKAVLDACLKGNKWAWGILYLNGPGVTGGKYGGDSICHVPSGDLDSVVRRDEPSFREIADVIKLVRKM